MKNLYRIHWILIFIFIFHAIAWCGGPFFNVLDYGAKNDSSARSTEAINAAIKAAKTAGGGTVYIPAGQYISGPIELVSNLILYIDAGAVIRFPAERLPFTKGRNQSIECLTAMPLIGGKNLENVTITGRGVVTTSNAEWMKLMPRLPGSAAGLNWENLLHSLEQKTPATDEQYQKAAPELRPPFIQLMESKNILIEGIHIIGSPMWPIHLLYSQNAVVRGVIVETYPGIHTGGIYIDSDKDVRISDCYIETGDDGIVLKSGKDADGRRVNRPTENISITNCTVRRAHGAVVLGSEIAGGIRNVVASNITCDGTQIGVRIKSRRGRGGVIEDVRFENWTMNHVGQAISITNYYMMEGETEAKEESVSVRTPIFRNIAISGMIVNHARLAMNIDGLPEMPIAGVRINDVVVSSKLGAKISNATALELHQVQVNADSGAAFLVRNSKDIELDGVTTRTPLIDAPVLRLDNCLNAIVRNCRTFAGTGTFLSTAPGQLKNIVLEGNAVHSAHQATEERDVNFWNSREHPTEGE
jgi:polygalacturonase